MLSLCESLDHQRKAPVLSVCVMVVIVSNTAVNINSKQIIIVVHAVNEVRHPWGCCTISLYFCSNPYFCNHVIVKEYLITLTGYRVSRATPIQWSQHCEREASSHRHQDSGPNFFNWYSDHSVAGSGRIAKVSILVPLVSCLPYLIISKDLWLNCLKNYERTMAPTEQTGRDKSRPGGLKAPRSTLLPTGGSAHINIWTMAAGDSQSLSIKVAACHRLHRPVSSSTKPVLSASALGPRHQDDVVAPSPGS
ncbi:Testis-specific Y-encoded protein 10 [Myotis davidii]|uniref:Testis-specific Y-encoded protein 10 n=1 Tax=Myotis davidii TaxID=225400 RepID=L5MBT7_MYODS|nr:Testis-specific Y-encoded protein 10 [Myotis davidii]